LFQIFCRFSVPIWGLSVARNAVERFEMIDPYRDRMNIHGIAEYTSSLSVLEVLFLMKADEVRDGIDIALQLEELAGAEQTLATVLEIDESPVYRQYFTCAFIGCSSSMPTATQTLSRPLH